MPQYQTGDNCVNTTLEAAQYQASTNDGAIVQIGTAQYVTSVISSSATAIQYRFTNVSSTAVINKTVIPTFIPCTKLAIADATSLAWLVVVPWVCAWGIKVVARGLSSGSTGETI